MKTVYILGAGFSVEAGAPTQAEIMKEAFRLYDIDPNTFKEKEFSVFKDFIQNQLNMSESFFPDIELEDIFTPLDRCLADSSQFRGISLDSIMEIREAVFYVVGRTIQVLLNESCKSKSYIDDFARYLTKASSVRANKNYRTKDPVSVISANWDILLDNSIYQSIAENSEYDAVVDYCCYISSKDEEDGSVKPGLEKLGQGGFNVKLLKLHGSLNWLQCPRCARLYARFSKKEAIHSFTKKSSCRHCDRNFSEEAGKHVLAPNLIMPTFLKDLSNSQYRLIWQNAGIELSEATKLVFIGYSLPSADFEMRQLLSRMTRKNAEIEVIDFCKNDDEEKQIEARKNIEKHWRRFFGQRDISFHFDGAKNYIRSIEPQS
jgi:NAD-dependent SIR2 family protein deacetylase